MTNLDKILDRIRAASEERIAALEKETDGEIARLDAEDAALLEQECGAVEEAARRDAERILTLARSSAVALRKKRVLEAKSRALDECVDAVLARLQALPEDAYADLVLTLVERGADGTPGTVYLAAGRPAEDRAAFAARLQALPGKTLTLAEETCPLDTGAMVSYGAIEVKLSFDAVAADRRDAIRDRLNELVFRDAAKE